MASSSVEANAGSLPSSMVFLRCNQGSELETPCNDRTIMKRKVQAKISELSPDIGRHMTLTKLHIKENGWSLLLFFEPIQEAMHAEVLELMKSWVGSQGSARFLSAQEVATQTIRDMQFRGEKRTASSSLGDLDKATSLLERCLVMQGEPAVDSASVIREQRRNSSLALRCFNRAQAQTAKSLAKSYKGSSVPKVEDEQTVSDDESNV